MAVAYTDHPAKGKKTKVGKETSADSEKETKESKEE